MKAYMGAEGKKAPSPTTCVMRSKARLAMIVAAAETDDELVMKYLEGEELTEEEIRHGLHQGVKNARSRPSTAAQPYDIVSTTCSTPCCATYRA